jgi:hypothetical protein
MATSLTVYMVTVATECCADQSGTREAIKKDVFLNARVSNLARRFKVSFGLETL